MKPRKENLIADPEAPHISFRSLESSHGLKPKLDQSKNANKEIAVDSSHSSWLVTPDIAPAKKNSYSGLESLRPLRLKRTDHKGRPILGTLTVGC